MTLTEKIFMEKVEQIFVDGIESISMADGVFRMEMFVYKNNEYQTGQNVPKHSIVCELLTSTAGLSRMQQAISQLISNLQVKANQESEPQKSNSVLSENFQ